MIELGRALVWSSVPVTFVALAALSLERIASRRGPRAGAWVASAALGLVIALTPLASCPIPAFSGWRISSAPSAGEAGSALVTVPGPRSPETPAGVSGRPSDGGRGAAWSAPLVAWLRGRVEWGTTPFRTGDSASSKALGMVLLAGMGASVFRLMIGLWGVSDARRRSRPVTDPGPLALVESFREALQIRGGVEVRELAGLATAAAVGWRRPLVLLPEGWRAWDDSERRAVLAHELAHIARADYAAGIVARVGLAVHSYHPLVRWLVGRLQLQQELAADAQGAELAGGRHPYTLALSRLALRADGRSLAWPAGTFLPAKGHLIRRIHVLNSKISAKDGTLPVAGRALVIGLLLAVGLGVTALRPPTPSLAGELSPAPSGAAKAPAAVEAPGPEAPAYDLSYVPEKAMGFFAIHPAALFRRPGTKVQRDQVNALLAKVFPDCGLTPESIEQMTVGIYLHPRNKKTGQQGRFTMTGIMVRSVSDVDWKARFNALAKVFGSTDAGFVESRFDGKVYYHAKKLVQLGPDPCLYFPDARTVVLDDESGVRRYIQRGEGFRPEYARGDDWRKAERGLCAVVLNNRDQGWLFDEEPEEPAGREATDVLKNANRWILAVDGTDTIKIEATANCDAEQNGRRIVQAAEALLDRAKTALERDPKAPDGNASDVAKLALEVARRQLWACRVRQLGTAVIVRFDGDVSFADALKVAFAELF